MAASDSTDVAFEDVPAVPVGGVEAYVDRPGFQHGGIGVAACWYGGARAVADVLTRTAARRGPDPLTDAHLGAVDMRLHAAGAVLAQAAAEIDRDPRTPTVRPGSGACAYAPSSNRSAPTS